jgi:hypothetical protein
MPKPAPIKNVYLGNRFGFPATFHTAPKSTKGATCRVGLPTRSWFTVMRSSTDARTPLSPVRAFCRSPLPKLTTLFPKVRQDSQGSTYTHSCSSDLEPRNIDKMAIQQYFDASCWLMTVVMLSLTHHSCEKDSQAKYFYEH